MDPNQPQAAPAPAAAPGAAPAEDPLDKAFAAGAKKFGGAQGQKLAGNRGMSEKITDGFRKAIEKITGKKISPKISN